MQRSQTFLSSYPMGTISSSNYCSDSGWDSASSSSPEYQYPSDTPAGGSRVVDPSQQQLPLSVIEINNMGDNGYYPPTIPGYPVNLAMYQHYEEPKQPSILAAPVNCQRYQVAELHRRQEAPGSVAAIVNRNGRKRKHSGSECSSYPVPDSTRMVKIQKRQPEAEEQPATKPKISAKLRERQRTQALNEAFLEVRRSLPTTSKDKNTKIDTLKLASSYIKFLHYVVKCKGQRDQPGYAKVVRYGLRNTSLTGWNKEKLSYAFNAWKNEQEWVESNSTKQQRILQQDFNYG